MPYCEEQVFKRLVHCSVMCLNDTSMDKLYELISMGYKFQVSKRGQHSVNPSCFARSCRNAACELC
jgi:Organic solute transport protein 1